MDARLPSSSCASSTTRRAATAGSRTTARGALGAHLQLPLYQALLEEELGLPATALLISLRETGKPVPMMCQGEDRAALLANLEALLDRARLGDFPRHAR